MKVYVRPLSKTMLSKLFQCRQLEQEGKICLPEDIKYALAPLYKRGFISLKKTVINNKEIMAVFTTPEGIQYLEHYNTEEKKPLQVFT